MCFLVLKVQLLASAIRGTGESKQRKQLSQFPCLSSRLKHTDYHGEKEVGVQAGALLKQCFIQIKGFCVQAQFFVGRRRGIPFPYARSLLLPMQDPCTKIQHSHIPYQGKFLKFYMYSNLKHGGAIAYGVCGQLNSFQY